ncbi:MAG: FGGY-family carbohydrate kinase [Burkholderiaceae bacterium]|jgi:sugar (pentulose or hexulose) kinase|nr:FGGY-family carbohydrate kinase [Burkholderiaceae bacterium]
MAQTLLALDNGTQSVRALLFDRDGQLLFCSQVKFDPVYYAPQPGYAEQSAQYYWDCLVQAVQGLWRQGAHSAEIVAVTLTTQRATVVPVDREGRALRPAITWLDQREANSLPPMPLYWRLGFSLARATESVKYLCQQAEANWLMENEPEMMRKMHKFLLLSGYLTHRLTGKFRDAVASQVGFLPFDYRRQDWARSWDWRWQAIRLRREHLPDLVPAGQRLGEITAEAARVTGIPQGLPLIAAGADKACEVLGSGCLEPHLGALSFGTTATINTIRSNYVEATPLLPPYPAPVPGHYCTEIQTFRGFWMVNWFRKEFGAGDMAQAMQDDVPVEVLFDRHLQVTPAGNMGLMLQPFWSPGVREPGREAKGALIGFGDVHGRSHVYRAIVEGLMYSLRNGRERIEKRAKTRMTSLRASGGGAQSDAVVQIAADIFGLPVERPHTHETSGLGAAICAAVGMGMYPDFPSAVQHMTHVSVTVLPDAEHQALYNQLFSRVYQPLYARLRPLYREIRAITGYPR